MRVIRFLAGLVLLELAVMGLVVSLSFTLDLWSAAYWQRQAIANQFEHEACQRKHNILVKQIKVEGLWKRLGMGGQPWLQ
jgi:hypothetical protein